MLSEFFVVALPGLEDIVKSEIAEWYPGLEAVVSHGGVTVHCELARGLGMNLCLKTPTRILVRVASFKSSDFPKLYNKVRSIHWGQWIDPSCELDIQSSTRLSRIKIKRRIDETCMDAWMAYQKEVGAITVRGRKATLYVRFIEDHCTLSLDTSGERLHKRGERVFVGEAPLRETIAASLVSLVSSSDRSASTVEIVDPMMGSGTFLLEAFGRSEIVDGRSFGFESFAVKKVELPALASVRAAVVSLVGYESDAKTFAAAKSNLAGVAKAKSGVALNLRGENIFKAEPMPAATERSELKSARGNSERSELESGPANSERSELASADTSGALGTEDRVRRWLFCNPPYGERLKVKEPLADLYVKLFAACERVAKPDRACFLLPSKAVKGKFQLPLGWKVLEKRPFVNGGIPVTAFVFGRIEK